LWQRELLAKPRALEGTSIKNGGNGVDPIFSLDHYRGRRFPAKALFVTIYAESEDEILRLIRKYKEILSLVVFELSWNQSDIWITTHAVAWLIRSFIPANGILYPRGMAVPKEARAEQTWAAIMAFWYIETSVVCWCSRA
jgi:hypothetical protein